MRQSDEPKFFERSIDTMYNVPGYRNGFCQQDLQPAYEFHRRLSPTLQEQKMGAVGF